MSWNIYHCTFGVALAPNSLFFFSHPILEKNQHFFAYAWINKRFSTKLCQTHTKKSWRKKKGNKKAKFGKLSRIHNLCPCHKRIHTKLQTPQNKGLFAIMNVTWLLCSKSKVVSFSFILNRIAYRIRIRHLLHCA